MIAENKDLAGLPQTVVVGPVLLILRYWLNMIATQRCGQIDLGCEKMTWQIYQHQAQSLGKGLGRFGVQLCAQAVNDYDCGI